MHAARYGCVRYGGSAGGWIKVRSKIIGTCYGSTDLCIRKLRADLFQGKETLLLFTGTEMSKNNDIITTFATAGGPMAFHGATSGGQFKMLTYMISQSLAESFAKGLSQYLPPVVGLRRAPPTGLPGHPLREYPGLPEPN